MRIKDPINETEEPYNLVPLTDMVFNLLIFFMAATTFAQVEKELGVQLPRTTSSFQSLSAAPKDLTVNVDEHGRPVVRRQMLSHDDLFKQVSGTAKRNPRLMVIIRADKRGSVDGLDKVLDVVHRAGVNKVEISYITGGTAPPS
jgi:biopolymer transport protein ExbD